MFENASTWTEKLAIIFLQGYVKNSNFKAKIVNWKEARSFLKPFLFKLCLSVVLFASNKSKNGRTDPI